MGTTKRDDTAARSPDLVDRDFTADRPNALWVTDRTYVAGHMRTDMVLDALEMARWSRGTILEGPITHSDAGSQFSSIR